MVTDKPGIILATSFADCVPLFFVDPVHKAIGNTHSGWRGTVGMIGKKTVDKMTEAFGCNPKDIKAAICPSIGPCCFEVDAPVYEEFLKLSSSKVAGYLKRLIDKI